MSVSTIALKHQLPSINLATLKKKTKDNGFYTIIVPVLWLVSSIFASTRTESSPNGTGLLLAVNVQDVLMLVISCWLLYKSLVTRNFLLAVPWLGIMAYSIYFTQYKSIIKIISTFRYSRIVNSLPWLTVACSIAALIIRVFLTFRVLQVSTYLWYRKRLERELLYQFLD